VLQIFYNQNSPRTDGIIFLYDISALTLV